MLARILEVLCESIVTAHLRIWATKISILKLRDKQMGVQPFFVAYDNPCHLFPKAAVNLGMD
jgi:hypothetical protein